MWLAACGRKDEIVIYAGSDWYGHAPVWVGIREGIFRKHGFQVQVVDVGGSADRIKALEEDRATFAGLGEIAMLQAMGERRRDFYWIGSHNIASGNEGLVAIGVDSIPALKGKRIALFENTSIHLTIALLLEDAGLDIREDVEIIHAENADVVKLVRAGEADAGGIWEPYYTDLRKLKDATVLGTDKDTSLHQKFGMMSGPDVICAARKWVDEDPERAKNFFKAYFEAVEWCQDHHDRDKLVQIVVDEVGNEKAEVRAALEKFTWLGWKRQNSVMHDLRMFGQASEVCKLLKKLGRLEEIPEFKKWTKDGWFSE